MNHTVFPGGEVVVVDFRAQDYSCFNKLSLLVQNFNYHLCLRHHLGDGHPISTPSLMAIGVGVCQFGIRVWLDVMYLHPMMPVIMLMI